AGKDASNSWLAPRLARACSADLIIAIAAAGRSPQRSCHGWRASAPAQQAVRKLHRRGGGPPTDQFQTANPAAINLPFASVRLFRSGAVHHITSGLTHRSKSSSFRAFAHAVLLQANRRRLSPAREARIGAGIGAYWASSKNSTRGFALDPRG